LYDMEARRVVSRSQGHEDDVNTVCFADDSNQVYLSGSDDCTIKVWDRRCANTSGGGKKMVQGGEGAEIQPQGVLQGHTEGLTYVSPKGDGRYLISNGKDQKLKLWDIRRMGDNASHLSKKGKKVPRFTWDYRSLATFTGHKVLQTLIRCRWSPAETTGQRYVFSGSQCGSLFVYDVLTGEQAAVLKFHRSVLRDCDWHPHQPMLASVGWDGNVVRWQNLPDGQDKNK